MTHLPPHGRLGHVQSVITALYDVPVGVSVTNPRHPQPSPMGSEADHLTTAIVKRQMEFAAGRSSARNAMVSIGFSPCPIPAHADRSPIWPDGITGSISHKDTLCAAVVTRAPVTLGLDIEEDIALDAGLIPMICTPAEIDAITGPDQARLAKLIFSAKEAAYKAQYPVTGQLFGFDHMEVTLDITNHSFAATFVKPVAGASLGDIVPGRFAMVAGHLVTGAALRQGQLKGA